MDKTKIRFVGLVVIILVLVAIALVLFLSRGDLVADYSSTKTASKAVNQTSTTASSMTDDLSCSSDTSALADIPALPSDFQWSPATSTTLDSFTLDSHLMTLRGEIWSATSTETDDSFLQKILSSHTSYYHELMDQYAWQIQTNFDGHQIIGIEADGPDYGSDYGLIKIQNDKMRAIVLRVGRTWGLTFFYVFVSDIVPISQVIPDYKANCSS